MDTEDIHKHGANHTDPQQTPAQQHAAGNDETHAHPSQVHNQAVQLAKSEGNNDQVMMQRTSKHDMESQQPGTITQNTPADHRRGAPAVRLDMDLDVDIQLKAKIQGDITLAVLEGDQR